MDAEDRQFVNDEVKYVVGNTLFTWDDNKAIVNWEKHRVTFEDAAAVFSDEYAIDLPDTEHMETEDRRQIIGMVYERWEILFVVYVERTRRDNLEVIRIISARPARRKEQKLYERGLSK